MDRDMSSRGEIKRVKRDRKAVSPVVATILMVAITVVLAASLWVMLEDDEVEYELYGTLERGDRSRDDGWMRIDIASMDPSSVNLYEVTVELYDANDTLVCTLEGETGEREDFNDQGYSLAWTRVGDDEIDDTSRLYVDYDLDEDEDRDRYDFEGYGVVITAEGYGGHLSHEE